MVRMPRRSSCGALVVVLVTLSATANAAPPPPGAGAIKPEPANTAPTPTPAQPEDSVPADDAPEAAEVIRGVTPEALEDIWLKRRQALALFDRPNADTLLATMVDKKRQSGWPNLVTQGLAVARESIAVGNTGEKARALQLAIASTDLAPSRPETWAARARADFASGDIVPMVRDLVHAAAVIVSDPVELRLRLGNLALAAIAALLITSLIFALIALYRHQRDMVFGVQQVLPNGTTRLQAGLLVIAAVSAPLFVGLGPIWTILVWVSLPFIYYERKERIGACLVLIFLAALPLVLPPATQYLGYPGSRAQDIYLAASDMGERAASARIRQRATPTPHELLVLGLRERYSGRNEPAVRYMTQAAEQGLRHPSVYNAIGNAQLDMNNRGAAFDSYQKALSIDPKYVPALFNISRIYFSRAEHQKASSAHHDAAAIDPDLIEQFENEAKLRGPTYVAADEVPKSVVAVYNASSDVVAVATHDLWRELSGRTIPLWYAVIALSTAVIIGVTGAFVKRTSATSGQSGRKERTSVEPLQRIRHEIEVHRHGVRLLRMRQVVSLILAGAGQLMVGRSVSGLFMLSVFATSVIMLLVSLDVVPSPVPLSNGPISLALVVYAGAALVVYAASLWDNRREDR